MHLAAEGPVEGSLGFDSWVGIAGLVLAVVGLIATYVFYRRQKKSKRLEYSVISSQSLTTDDAYPGLTIVATWLKLAGGSEFPDRFTTGGTGTQVDVHTLLRREANRRLSYNEAEAAKSDPSRAQIDELVDVGALVPIMLKAPAVHRLEIQNTGTESMRRGDFATPITISVPHGRVVDCAVVKKSVPGIYPDGSISEDGPTDELTFTPELMNPGDWMDLVLLTEGTKAAPVLTCWIEGETHPMRAVTNPNSLPQSTKPLYLRLVLAAIFAVAVGVLSFQIGSWVSG